MLDRLSYECYLTEKIPEAINAKEASLKLWRTVGSRAREGDALRWLSRLNWFTTNKALADAYASDAFAALAPLAPGCELEVVVLLAEGRRNADIAKRLFVAEKTVDHHVSAVLAKLNVRSRSEAAALANQLGLTTPAKPECRADKS